MDGTSSKLWPKAVKTAWIRSLFPRYEHNMPKGIEEVLYRVCGAASECYLSTAMCAYIATQQYPTTSIYSPKGWDDFNRLIKEFDEDIKFLHRAKVLYDFDR